MSFSNYTIFPIPHSSLFPLAPSPSTPTAIFYFLFPIPRSPLLPSNVRPVSWQPGALCMFVDLRVHRPARRIHIRLRGRVLRNSTEPDFGVLGCGPEPGRAWHLGYSSRSGRRRLRSRSPRRRSLRLRGVSLVAILCRQDTASAPSAALHRAFAEPRRRRIA